MLAAIMYIWLRSFFFPLEVGHTGALETEFGKGWWNSFAKSLGLIHVVSAIQALMETTPAH